MATLLVFFCLLESEPLLPHLREKILSNFEFKNEATRANLQVNIRILNCWPFWNKVYKDTCTYMEKVFRLIIHSCYL